MSRSPERISSYRRHFEDSSSFSQQVRVSSPSPTRRDARRASTGYTCRGGPAIIRVESVGRRTGSAVRRSRMLGTGVGAGAMVCVGPSGETPIDLDVASAENKAFMNIRTGERQEMVILNDRLAVYIDKVRSLEQQNKLLEAEIEAYQNRFEKPSGLRLLYEEQLRELRRIAEQMRRQRDISVAAKDSTAAQLEAIKIKYEEAVELRKKSELEIENFRPDVDQATSSRIALEKKLEQLEVEIEFIKRVHQQEIDELMKQIYSAHASVQSTFTLPDLAGALKQIQNQYDDIAAKNLQEMDSWYKNKFEDLTKKTSGHVDRVRNFRDEIAGARKDIQSKGSELDSLRTRNEALEAQIREMQEKYRKELEDLQARIEALQLELKSTKEKIALHLREYQDLLNMKMSLEIEITTYRKLVEGEDLRLTGSLQGLSLATCSMSAIGAGTGFGGGSMGGAGGMGGGSIGGSGTDMGGVGFGGGMGGGSIGGSGTGMGGMSYGGGMGGGSMSGTGGRAGGMGMAGGMGGPSMSGSGGGAGSMGMAGGMGGGSMSGSGGGTGSMGMAGGMGGGPMSGSGGGAGGMGMGGGMGGGPMSGSGGGAGGMGMGGGMGGGPMSGSGGGTGSMGMGGGMGGSGAGGMGMGGGMGGSGAGGMGMGGGMGGDSMSGSGAAPGRMGSGGGIDRGTSMSPVSIDGVSDTVSAVIDGKDLVSRGIGTDKPDSLGFGAGGLSGIYGGSAGLGSLGGGIGAGMVGEGMGTGSGSMGSGGIGGSGMDFGGGSVEGVRGSGGTGGTEGGKAKAGGGVGDISGTDVTHGSDGYGHDGNINAYGDQAVELTERRTVLIRTVKKEGDVLETDHQEQTYTISGAADESEDE